MSDLVCVVRNCKFVSVKPFLPLCLDSDPGNKEQQKYLVEEITADNAFHHLLLPIESLR